MAEDFAIGALAEIRAAGLLRRLRCVDGDQDSWVTLDGRRVLLLCSNNYLGLANHPALRAAAARAATDYGVGSGASRLISGSMRLHQRLEERLAALKGAEAALLFNSGYHANIGAVGAFVGRGDAVFSDALNHASIVDGCRLSGATVLVYPHNDVAALSRLLAESRARRRLVVTESIFSMDGDGASLRALCDIAERHGAMVMVDEAHATGILGPNGGGLVEAEGLQERVDLQVGTLGKALGSFGAFVAGRRAVIDLLINTARSFIYTTALPPPTVAASLAALDIIAAEPARRRQVLHNAGALRRMLAQTGFDVGTAALHIIPVHVGDPQRTMQLSEHLLAQGVFVQGIRPPTVPAATARLRVTVMSTHTPADFAFARDAFQRAYETVFQASETLKEAQRWPRPNLG